MGNSDYGLELTNNSKVGWAFSLSRSETCINATEICKTLCYGNGIRYQSEPQRAKRRRNYRTVQLLLQEGGPELLAENLLMLVDQARPRDWLAARVRGTRPAIPWTIRIHDVGDFFSVPYVQAWQKVVNSRAQCSFWFYTRSFLDEGIFEALCELAALTNCQGWLSVDSENYGLAVFAKCKAPSVWMLALLQDKDLNTGVLPALTQSSKRGGIVNFPYHRGGYHVTPLRDRSVTVCPAVTGSYKLESNRNEPRP